MMSSVARLLGAVVFCALFATPAHAQNYVAEFKDQCCYMTLESGEVAGGQFFEYKNVGAATWVDRNFKLAIDHQVTSSSPFWHPSWYEVGRPARVPVQPVQERPSYVGMVEQAEVVGARDVQQVGVREQPSSSRRRGLPDQEVAERPRREPGHRCARAPH
jgi:hypothetical protein